MNEYLEIYICTVYHRSCYIYQGEIKYTYMNRSHIGMPDQKLIPDSVKTLKKLDHTKMILIFGVARVVPVDKTGRVLGAEFFESVLKGNMQISQWRVELAGRGIVLWEGVALRWSFISHANRESLGWQIKRTQRKQIYFRHTEPQTEMIEPLRGCTPKVIRWGKLPLIPCLCVYISNYVTAFLLIKSHVIVIKRHLRLILVDSSPSRIDRGIANEIVISCNSVWEFWITRNYIHITYSPSSYWKNVTLHLVGLFHICSCRSTL